jgi:hypothetical protein
MFTDIPTDKDYRNSAIECLIQAYDNIWSIDNSLNNDTPREEIWDYHQIVLRTGIVLIHQGVEGLMKAEVCKVSPLLLIDKKRSEWKTLPDSADESFSNAYTIAGDDLLRTFFACITPGSVPRDFLAHYEEVRTKRNKIAHGVSNDQLTPEYVLTLVLSSFTYLIGKDSFWASVLEKFYQHPGHEHDDFDLELEEMMQYNRMDHLHLFLKEAELKSHFSVDITARPYLCPDCTEKGEVTTKDGMTHPESKWAFLNPNLPDANNLSCIVCQMDFEVIREDCGYNGCKGNVKYLLEEADGSTEFKDIWVCLTCWHEEEKKSKDENLAG